MDIWLLNSGHVVLCIFNGGFYFIGFFMLSINYNLFRAYKEISFSLDGDSAPLETTIKSLIDGRKCSRRDADNVEGSESTHVALTTEIITKSKSCKIVLKSARVGYTVPYTILLMKLIPRLFIVVRSK